MTKSQKERERRIWWSMSNNIDDLVFHTRLVYIDQEAVDRGSYFGKWYKK